jgi:hypothetical protein
MGKGIRLGILSVMAMLQEQSTSQSPHRIESSNKTLLRLHRDVVLKVIRGASRAYIQMDNAAIQSDSIDSADHYRFRRHCKLLR